MKGKLRLLPAVVATLALTLALGGALSHGRQQWAVGCTWVDPLGNEIGQEITYIPPDTPESGGYTCQGHCMGIGTPSVSCGVGPEQFSGEVAWKRCSCAYGSGN